MAHMDPDVQLVRVVGPVIAQMDQLAAALAEFTGAIRSIAARVDGLEATATRELPAPQITVQPTPVTVSPAEVIVAPLPKEVADLLRDLRDGIDQLSKAKPPQIISSAGGVRNSTFTERIPNLSLTSRMLAKQPAAGREIWMDTADTTQIIIAEATAGQTDTAATVWQGIRMPLDANGNVIGRITERANFAWANRATGW